MTDVISDGPNGPRRGTMEQLVVGMPKDELARLALLGVTAARDEWRRRRDAGQL